MTDEQIELEFAHMELDRKVKSGNGDIAFEDDTFGEYEKEVESENEGRQEDASEGFETENLDDPELDTSDLDNWEDIEDF